jgi:hypothetical protein
MDARNKHILLPIHNHHSNDTTSGTSRSTESKMQGSYNWQRNDPPLPEVDTTTLLQMRRSEESHANELRQRIQALEAQIIEYNKSKYDKILKNGQRGKNILQESKHTLSTQDQINQGVVAAFLRESVWPQTKILPKNWTKWREDKNSLYQMILKKVSVSVSIEGRMYCDLMLLSMTNGKFCLLRSKFKQEIFK